MKYLTLITLLMCGQLLHAQTFTKTEQFINKGFEDDGTWDENDAPNAYIDIIENMVMFKGNANSERNYFYTEQNMLNRAEPFTVSCDVKITTLGTNNNFGIVVGEPARYAEFYTFSLNANGQYLIEVLRNRVFATKKYGKLNSAIKNEPDAVNTLKVSYNTSEKNSFGFYSFYCNNILLDTITAYLRTNEKIGVSHKNDGEVHFSNFNLVQEKYDIVEKKTSLKEGLTTIENASTIGFWPFKKSSIYSSEFENSFLLERAESTLTDYNLVYTYGPYITQEEAENERIKIVNEIKNIRKSYLQDQGKPKVTYFSRTIKNGYLEPHIYVSSFKKKEAFFTKLEFALTKNLLQYNFINQAAKTTSNFAKSFFRVWEAAMQATPFENLKGGGKTANNKFILKSNYTIEETNNNVIESSTSLSGIYYKTEIATAMDKETALSTQNTWFIKLKEILGKEYAYSEKLYDRKGYLEEKHITFIKALPIMSPQIRIEAQLFIQFDVNTRLYNCKLQIVSFPQ